MVLVFIVLSEELLREAGMDHYTYKHSIVRKGNVLRSGTCRRRLHIPIDVVTVYPAAGTVG
jgi:hypothetical protein